MAQRDTCHTQHTDANFGLLGPICEPQSDPLMDDLGGNI